MTVKRKGLGRNLDVLLSVKPATVAQPVTIETADNGERLQFLAVDKLQRGKYQPRKDMDPIALEELANSIKAQGLLQPIVARAISPQQYEIIAGERRWRAAQMAGLTEIPVLIKEVSDQVTMALALIENIQRENLNPLEEAIAMQRLIDECQLTHQQVAEALGKSRAAVSNLLRLMALNPDVKQLLERGDIELGHAKVLLALSGHPQSHAAKQVSEKQLSVRETEALVKRLQTAVPERTEIKRADPDVRELLQNLSEKLGAKVELQHTPKGRGKLLVHYNSLDELEGILGHIK
jgi:ParB family chromosome partitioning protein